MHPFKVFFILSLISATYLRTTYKSNMHFPDMYHTYIVAPKDHHLIDVIIQRKKLSVITLSKGSIFLYIPLPSTVMYYMTPTKYLQSCVAEMGRSVGEFCTQIVILIFISNTLELYRVLSNHEVVMTLAIKRMPKGKAEKLLLIKNRSSHTKNPYIYNGVLHGYNMKIKVSQHEKHYIYKRVLH